MPRGFNDNERRLIKAALIEKGKNLFSTLGLRKTGIEDLTKAAGIAQGSFYNFFSSKEELYFEILEKEEESIKSTLLKDFHPAADSPADVIKRFLSLAFELIENNPFIKRLCIDNAMETLVRVLPGEKFAEHKKRDSSILLFIIKEWKDNGIVIEKEPEVIAGLIRSVLMISRHRDQIGEEVYSDSLELLVELLAEGLAKRGMNGEV